MNRARSVGWLLALGVLVSCSEDAPLVFSIQLPVGYEDAVTWDVLGVRLAGEPVVCSASGDLLVEPIPGEAEDGGNIVVDRQHITPVDGGIEVEVLAGEYAFYVEGFDEADEKVAQGCGQIAIEAGQTRDLEIGILPFYRECTCGDGEKCGFEQCDGEYDWCDRENGCVTNEMQASSPAVGVQDQPAISVGEPFVLAFRSAGVLRYRGFRGDGTLRGGGWYNDQPVRGPDVGCCDRPAVGVGGTQFVIAYNEARAGAPIERDVRFTLHSWGEGEDTATLRDSPANDTPDDGVNQRSAAVAVQDDGSFFVAWLDGDTPDARVRAFDPAGAPAGASVQVSPGGAVTKVMLVPLDGGNYVAALEQGGARFQILRNLAGTPTAVGDTEMVAASAAEVSVGVSSGRTSFALAWIDGRDVKFQAFDDAGDPVGAEPTIVSAGGTNRTPAVGGGPTGNWYVVWVNDGDVWGRYVEGDGTFALGPMSLGDDGAPSRDAFVVDVFTDGNQSLPVMAMNDSLAFVAWIDPGTVDREDTDGSIRYRFLTEPVE